MSITRYTLPNEPSGKIADKDGNIDPNFRDFLTQLMGYLTHIIGNEGLVAPPLTQGQIDLLTKAVNGTIVYNTTTMKLQAKTGGTGIIGGTFKDIV